MFLYATKPYIDGLSSRPSRCRTKAARDPTHVSIRSDLREGRDLGVPLCCRLLFAVQWRFFPNYEQAVHRGIRFNPDGIQYVPCGILHRATVTHAEHESMLALKR
jgi:hypothetical protein